MQALVSKHYFYGGYYPVGGASRIAGTILPSVVEAGGAVRVNAEVQTVIMRKGRAVGVRLASGEEITAPVVISDAGAVNTAHMLPESERGWAAPIESLEPSPAHLCLYLGFEGDIRAAGATPANLWLYDSWDHDAMLGWRPERGDPPPCLYVSFPSLKDPEHDPGPEMLHTGEIVTFVPWEPFARWAGTRWKKRGDDYEAFKRDLGDRMLGRLCAHLPALRPLVAHAELSTPLTTEHFARSHRGSIYGLEHSPARFALSSLRPRTPIRGLYLTGCDVSTGGVMGAAFGGVLTAAALEPRRTIQLLTPLARRR
jgi:all-trans-retinol 13,14-reductase